VVLAQLALEGRLIPMKEQRDLVALTIAVDDAKSALHQMFRRSHNVVAQALGKGHLKPDLLSE
jgi:hypothetical protein